MGIGLGQIIIIVLISILIFGDLPKILKSLKISSKESIDLKKKKRLLVLIFNISFIIKN